MTDGPWKVDQLTFWSEELPASPSASPDSGKDWMTRVVSSPSSMSDWLNDYARAGSSGKTSLESCRAEEDKTLLLSSLVCLVETFSHLTPVGKILESLNLPQSAMYGQSCLTPTGDCNHGLCSYEDNRIGDCPPLSCPECLMNALMKSRVFMASHGGCWTLNTSEWPSAAAVCSLSDTLETGAVPQRFFLSAKACAGILRRAEKRGKALPQMLHQALSQVAEGAREQETPEDKTQ